MEWDTAIDSHLMRQNGRVTSLLRFIATYFRVGMQIVSLYLVIPLNLLPPLPPLLRLFVCVSLSLYVSVSFSPVEWIWENRRWFGYFLSQLRCTKKALRAEPKTLTAF